MEELRLPDNVKIHFAGAEVLNQFVACRELGVRYALYTAFPFVDRMVFGKSSAPIMPQKWMTKPDVEIPQFICKDMKHVIQDSGLFTLMFGSKSNIPKTEQTVARWYDGLVKFTLNHGLQVTCVEVDCQKVLGVEKAWEFRERMRKDLPNNRIINVFHLEDGMKGLDRLIEFSDYIAISVPELRFANKTSQVPSLAKYIKRKKPNIDIHLLGCTQLELLRQCSFCTSADSTTYTTTKRYGYINGKHIRNIEKAKVIEYFGQDVYNTVSAINSEDNTNVLLVTIEDCKHKCEKAAGNQDFLNFKKKKV